MPKTKISEFDTTPANNTDIGGINIAEGCAPSNINNAIRELMAQLKDQQAGTDNDNFTVGGNLTVTGTSELLGATKLFLNAASSTAAAPALAWSGDSNTGIYSPASDAVSVATGGTERVRVNSTGALIIGSGEATTSPSGNILRASSGSGTNVIGGNLEITSGNGTGTGGSGNIIFKTADVGASSGSTANTMTQRLLITKKGGFSFGSGSTSYGSPGQVLISNGDAPPSYGTLKFLFSAQTLSGSGVTFNVSSGFTKYTIMLSNVSTAAAGTIRIRLGTSSGVVTTGYDGGLMTLVVPSAIAAASLGAAPEGIAGFFTSSASTLVHGILELVNVSGNTYVCSGSVHRNGDNAANISNGTIDLGAPITTISIVATTSTFDAGTVNVFCL
jgi:hypothetical protein